MLDFFSYADGDFDLLEIAEILGVPCAELLGLAETFRAHGLVRIVEPDPQRLARRRFPWPPPSF
jgi:DNA-binding IclR family transcriptional regulator